MKKIISLFFLYLLFFASIFPQSENTDKMEWFREARFGMFIHWGVYSVLGGEFKGTDVSGQYVEKQVPNAENFAGAEWIMYTLNIPRSTYRTYANEFTAANYSPEQIVKYAKDAGMKYIVITAKHHEGFCLFPTKVSDWNVANTPAKKDLLKPLVEACKVADLKIGFYFSQNADWMHEGGMGEIPELNSQEYDYLKQKNYVENNVCPMIKEILTNYDIDILWFDFGGISKYEDLSNKIYKTVNQYRKNNLIINDRLSPWHHGDYETPEQNIDNIPANGFEDERIWERCMTMDVSWGYTIPDHHYNGWWCSKEMAVEQLMETASKGGNFLVNIGPDKEGNIPEGAIERLENFSDWMSRNSEAVYGTTANPILTYNPYGFFTKKKNDTGLTVYYAIKNYIDYAYIWPSDGKFLIRGLYTQPKRIFYLANNEKIEAEVSENGLILQLGEEPLETSMTVVVMEFDKELEQTYGIGQDENGNIMLDAIEANFSRGLILSENPFNIGYWNSNSYSCKWTINVTKPGIFRISGEVSSPGSGDIHFKINGTTANGEFKATDGYHDYQDQMFTTTTLTKGAYDIEVSITMRDAWGCNIKNLLLEQIGTDSIDDILIKSPRIIRNSSGNFTLLSGDNQRKKIQIFNPEGLLISSFESEDNHIPFSVKHSGMFIIKISRENNTVSTKFIN